MTREEDATQEELTSTPVLGALDVLNARGAPDIRFEVPDPEEEIVGPPSITRGIGAPLVADFAIATDDVLEEHSKRLQFAAFGKFLEEHFVTPAIIGDAIRAAAYNRLAACRLNVLRAYSSYVQTFGALKLNRFY